MADRSLAEIAAELYAGPPAEFTAARDAAAKSIDDKDLAARIRRLKKPSVAAWVVNLFATERAAQLGEALQLAEELREAQADLDAATLSALGRERRTLTNRLAEYAAELAAARGERVTASTLEAVRQTLSAAFFDADAAAAVASGRLVRELEPSGEVDLAEAVAGGAAERPHAPPPVIDEVRERRERREAERAVQNAEKALERAERERTTLDRDRRRLDEKLEELTVRLAELEEELSRTERSAVAARSALEAADRRVRAGADRVDEASAALEVARKALADTQG